MKSTCCIRLRTGFWPSLLPRRSSPTQLSPLPFSAELLSHTTTSCKTQVMEGHAAVFGTNSYGAFIGILESEIFGTLDNVTPCVDNTSILEINESAKHLETNMQKNRVVAEEGKENKGLRNWMGYRETEAGDGSNRGKGKGGGGYRYKGELN